MKSKLFVLVGLLALPSTTAHAQTPTLADGDRVKFKLVGATIEHRGRVRDATRDSVILRSCDDCHDLRFAITDFAVLSAYHRVATHRVTNAVSGTLVGLVAGLLTGGAVGAK